MPIISAFPTGESTVDYTGPKSGLPSLEEGKVAYVTDEKRLYTGNADGTNTQVPNADDVKTDVSDTVSSHNSATDAHADKFAKYLQLAGGKMTGAITGGDSESWVYKIRDVTSDTGLRQTTGLFAKDGVIAFKNESTDGAQSTIGLQGNETLIARKGSDGKMNGISVNSSGVYINNVVTPTTDTMPTPKSYVDAAASAVTPNACKVTLTASGWDSTAKTQSATVSGVLEDESKQLIMPMPAGTSMSAYNEAGIQMTAQGDNSVTFTADTVPTTDVEVWVVVQSVNDVTPIPTLDEARWSYISKQSLAGNAKNLWAVGDCKAVKLSGTASKLSLDTTLYVYILDFDHDQSSANGAKDGITFGTFKNAATGGIDVCLVSGDSDNSDFIMYPNSTNAGGWKNSDMRYNILGSTNTQNGDATNTTATSPKANTLLSCFPAELRKVMRPMYIYSDNTGGGSDIASYVTGTLDYLPLLAEYEIHGSRYCANSAESTKQTQYAYFKNGNSKIKKRHDNLNSSGVWRCRSTYATYSGAFCCVATTGIATMGGVNISSGVAPMFKV